MSSRRRRKREEAPLPAASAGLLRFFEEETEGLKIKPGAVVAAAITLIVLCIMASLLA